MKILKNLKTKFIKQKPQPVVVDTVSVEEDIALLAMMCQLCAPRVTKKGIHKTVYSYFIPQEERFLELAKALFVKNGINMERHRTRLLDRMGNEALRAKIKGSNKNNDQVAFMTQVKQKHQELFLESNVQEMERLNYILQNMERTR